MTGTQEAQIIEDKAKAESVRVFGYVSNHYLLGYVCGALAVAIDARDEAKRELDRVRSTAEKGQSE